MPQTADYPRFIEAFRLTARDGKPPHPEDIPAETRVVHSEEDRDRAEAELKKKYPNAWLVERPMDWL